MKSDVLIPVERLKDGPPTSRLRAPQRQGMREHFGPTDPPVDLTRLPVIGRPLTRALKSRKFLFFAILPNEIVFMLVIGTGFFGVGAANRNFSTVITWYLWFCALFLLMVGVGRGWCQICPFGGAAEWIQRGTFWERLTASRGLGRSWPASLAKFGLLPSVGLFVVLTWFEEFFNIAGPGQPILTALLVAVVIVMATSVFLIFEQRTFCRYLCPLSALIGTVGATGMAAGFRTRDREVCLSCATKDCMRGSESGYGCPWYEWPGSATSNLTCGLCTECFKNCPHENVGLFVQAPLTSVIAPVRRRFDIAWGVLILLGLVVFQQVNALAGYTNLDNALNAALHFPGYPNPVDFLGFIGLGVAGMAGYTVVMRQVFANPAARLSRSFNDWLAPLAYGLIPLVGADYLARQLPKFWDHVPRLINAISDPFGFGWNIFGTAHLAIGKAQLLPVSGVVVSQVVVATIGGLAATYATARILRRDGPTLSDHPRILTVVGSVMVLLLAVGIGALYVMMGGAE